MEPLFVSFEQVLRAHEESVRRHSGSSGIRCLSYRASPGVPGWKQANGNCFSLTFLEQNGIAAGTSTDTLYDAMIGIAERRLSKADLAAVFRKLFGQ